MATALHCLKELILISKWLPKLRVEMKATVFFVTPSPPSRGSYSYQQQLQ